MNERVQKAKRRRGKAGIVLPKISSSGGPEDLRSKEDLGIAGHPAFRYRKRDI